MQKLIDLIQSNQSFLSKRTLEYAKLHGFTKYTSTLEEPWMASISGLSYALIESIRSHADVPEIEVDSDFSDNALSTFGVLEAKQHRSRGVSLVLFLSLMKYYRQAFIDLTENYFSDIYQLHSYQLWINRFFDYNEISFINEWTAKSDEFLLKELQIKNIYLTNEKNKFLTIFESTPNPAIFVNTEHKCVNMNFSARQLLQKTEDSSGSEYYITDSSYYPSVSDVLPWLKDEYSAFCNDSTSDLSIEKIYESPLNGQRILSVKFSRMLDVSGKFEGTVILLNDLTDYKNIEAKLRQMSFHDQLTGLYNRTYMEEEIVTLATGRFNPVGFISIDVDGLKLINDNFGHSAGDNLLVNVSSILKNSCSESDIAVRMGGDEFGILMPLSDAVIIRQTCRKIRDNIDEYNKINPDLPISMSIGWSFGNLHINSNIIEIIKEADIRMYEDKQINHLKYEILFKERFIKAGSKQI